jgi:hypothetical protein
MLVFARPGAFQPPGSALPLTRHPERRTPVSQYNSASFVDGAKVLLFAAAGCAERSLFNVLSRMPKPSYNHIRLKSFLAADIQERLAKRASGAHERSGT